MRILLRIIVTSVTAVATFLFTFWIGGGLLFPIFSGARDMPPESSAAAARTWEVITFTIAIVATVLAVRYVWKHTASLHAGWAGSILLGAFVMGSIGFIGGFFGPLVFMPGANQGPLLGIFFTGPLGFLLGAAGGAVYWARWGRRHTAVPQGDTAEKSIRR